MPVPCLLCVRSVGLRRSMTHTVYSHPTYSDVAANRLLGPSKDDQLANYSDLTMGQYRGASAERPPLTREQMPMLRRCVKILVVLAFSVSPPIYTGKGLPRTRRSRAILARSH